MLQERYTYPVRGSPGLTCTKFHAWPNLKGPGQLPGTDCGIEPLQSQLHAAYFHDQSVCSATYPAEGTDKARAPPRETSTRRE